MPLSACLLQSGTNSPAGTTLRSATHLTAFWWQRTWGRGLLAAALAAGGVDPEAKTDAVGQGGDGVVKVAVLGGHTGTISPGDRVTFP